MFEWNDPETDAKGWVVINSLKGGAAGGGTRMRKGLTKEEVMSLAKVMEIKFSVCGPAIGGAKSGIDFDPRDPRRTEVLERWYKAVFPLLKKSNFPGMGIFDWSNFLRFIQFYLYFCPLGQFWPMHINLVKD